MNKEEIKIGMWYSHCCHLDLYQINTQETLDNVIESMDDEDFIPDIWNTKLEALIDIQKRVVADSEEWKEIQKKIDELNTQQQHGTDQK